MANLLKYRKTIDTNAQERIFFLCTSCRALYHLYVIEKSWITLLEIKTTLTNILKKGWMSEFETNGLSL